MHVTDSAPKLTSTSLKLSGYSVVVRSTHIVLLTHAHLSRWLELSHTLVLDFSDAASLADTSFRQPCCSVGTHSAIPLGLALTA